MKFLAVLTMLAVSGMASAQMGSASGTASPTSVSPSAAPSGTATMQDSAGTMNTDPNLTKGKNIDSTKANQQRMEERDSTVLDSAGSIENSNMDTVPSTSSPVNP